MESPNYGAVRTDDSGSDSDSDGSNLESNDDSDDESGESLSRWQRAEREQKKKRRQEKEEKKSVWSTLFKLVKLSLPDFGYLFFGFLFLTGSAIAEMQLPSYTGKVSDSYVGMKKKRYGWAVQ